MFAYSDPDEPIGPEPVNSPEARQHWHAAFAALRPVGRPGSPGLSDGQLLMRRGQYERETAWAPQWVGDQLQRVRTGADDAEREAVLSSARAEAARKRDEHDQAQLHDTLAGSQRAMAGRYRGLEAKFAESMEARREWEETTRQQRHDALAAQDEYMRRHPDSDLEPLRSAEPEPVTDEQDEQLHAPADEYATPGWLADMTERTRAANEELADRAQPGSARRGTTSGRATRHGRTARRFTVTRSCSRRRRRSSRRPRWPSARAEADREAGE